ncbi:VIT1/CCC1 transporter family protein [Levilactobacillus enshiensis]|uniref:VIT1/CCC1 transporter family protein n=1 Tax=Levilactobacillus enshiensis TaxID=2590213 RepID=UPI001179E679|nr:VIT1/CCC1 transporter family protein [Levilactobacillus enshiensis]
MQGNPVVSAREKKMSAAAAGIFNKLNRVRALVLGSNDGIVSTAGLVIGVTQANHSVMAALLAGLFTVLAGALSMAGGEYSSVSSQRDMQKALAQQVKAELVTEQDMILQRLKVKLQSYGFEVLEAVNLSRRLIENENINVILYLLYGITYKRYTSPLQAAVTDGLAFTLGAALPLSCIVWLPEPYKIGGTMIGVVLALLITGYVAARLGHANAKVGMLRNAVVGLLTMGVSYFIGSLWQ